MSQVYWRRVAGIVLVCAGALAAAQPVRAQPATATIRGVVLDRADGSPIADVSVRLQDDAAGVSVTTDAAGRFELAGVAPGRRIVYVSLVGFILVRRPVEVVAGELLLKQVTDGDDNFGFGFSDVQSKLVYDVSPRHRVELSVVAGQSRLEQTSSLDDVNTVDDGRNRAALVNGAWRFTPSPRFVVTQRLAIGTQTFRNRNVTSLELGRGSAREITWRTDFVATGPASITFEGGGQIQSQHRDEFGREFQGPALPQVVVAAHDAGARLSSAHGQARWSRGSRGSVAAGARVDHWSLTRDWWRARTAYDLRISQLVIDEAAVGDEFQRARRLRALRGIPVLSLTDSATRLARELVRQGALPEKATVDAFHIGVAAAHDVTYLLTWNCKHLANATMRGTIEAVCRSEGLSPPVICTPEELPVRRPS